MSSPPPSITQLLVRWGEGDQAALDELVPMVERELRRLARHYMRHEGAGHLLQTTALVNEAYLRLVEQRDVRWQNRAHFFAIAAQLMRRVLVDYARSQQRIKRGGVQPGARVPLEEAILILPEKKSRELIDLDDALHRLSEIDPRKSQVVEMRHFGGMSVEEVAEVLGVSAITVMRDWSMAKAWLKGEVRR